MNLIITVKGIVLLGLAAIIFVLGWKLNDYIKDRFGGE